jgi:hypothetical protein
MFVGQDESSSQVDCMVDRAGGSSLMKELPARDRWRCESSGERGKTPSAAYFPPSALPQAFQRASSQALKQQPRRLREPVHCNKDINNLHHQHTDGCKER